MYARPQTHDSHSVTKYPFDYPGVLSINKTLLNESRIEKQPTTTVLSRILFHSADIPKEREYIQNIYLKKNLIKKGWSERSAGKLYNNSVCVGTKSIFILFISNIFSYIELPLSFPI